MTTAGVTTTYPITGGTSTPGNEGRGIVVGADGSVYFAEDSSDAYNILSINTAGLITEHAVPTSHGVAWGLALGPDEAIWFTENGTGKIGRLLSTATNQLAAAGTIFLASQGTLFSGDVAYFADANSLDIAGDFTATIDWGDGRTSTGTVSVENSDFVVQGSHNYASSGLYTVRIAVFQSGGVVESLNWSSATGMPFARSRCLGGDRA